MNVIIRAPLLSISGYGVHSRQVFKWLNQKENVNITSHIVQWGNTSWMINPEMENGLVGEIIKTSRPPEGLDFDASFQVQLPDEWDPNLAKFNVGITAAVETDRCNPEWVERINMMDAVIVPSNHIKKTIQNTGIVRVPLLVIPEWYHEDIDNKNFTDLGLDLDTSFNFLTVAQLTANEPENDRKNLLYTIKWFCEAFEGDKDVGLIVKTNHGRGTRIDRTITKNKIRKLISEVRNGPYPKIHLIHGNLSTSEISGLYKNPTVKGLISTTRGEGFGLPLLEAAACGLPVIVTNWSAHLDFMSLGKFIPIKYKLVEISPTRVDNRIFLEGFKWANPDEADFKNKIVKFRNKYKLPEQWAKELSKKIKSNFSSKKIMSIYDESLQTLVDIK